MPDWKEELKPVLAGLNLPPEREAEILEEIAQHLADHYGELLSGGATEADAQRTAIEEVNKGLLSERLERVERRIGQESAVLGEARRDRVILAGLWQDTRFGLRVLAKRPALTALAIVTLALGIGVNATLFSIVNALLFRPLPVPHPEQIYTMASAGKMNGNGFSYQELQDIRKQTSSLFSDVAGTQFFGATGITFRGKSERMWTDYVTGSFFAVSGVRPALGRFFLPSEGQTAGADPVLVVSHSFWKTHLGADPNIIGKQARVNGRPVTIVGVAPEGFRPVSTLLDTQGYLPLGMAVIDNQTKSDFLNDRNDKRLILVARLKPGVTPAKIRSVMEVVAKRLAAAYPKTDDWTALNAFPLPPSGPTSSPSEGGLNTVGILFLSLAGVVLILACANVASILFARASVRRGEIAIRAALGAKRSRIIWQLLTESLLLALFGGLGGLLAGLAGSRVVGSLPLHTDFPIILDFHFDWRVFGYALTLAILSGVIAGIAPAWRATSGDLNEVLHGAGRVSTAGGHGFRKGLVIAQVAGSLMLMIVAGLFVRSLLSVQRCDLGFDPQDVLNVRLDPSLAGYSESESYDFLDRLLPRVNALPGVQAASLAVCVPMGGNNTGAGIDVEGAGTPRGQQLPGAGYNVVSAGYFETMSIPVLRGRGIAPTDTANSMRVAVINQAMAERFWRGKDPIGRRFRLEGEPDHPVEVVGVVRNSRTSDLYSTEGPFFYMALAQRRSLPLTLQVRSYGNPESMAPDVVGLIRSLAPALPVGTPQTMTDALDGLNGWWLFRLGAGLTAAMGILGLILAIIGVYGIVAYMAAQRTHEIGMRLALGAAPRDILKMVLRQGISVILPGAALGVLMAFGAAHLLAHLLVGVSSTDPITYASLPVLLLVVALAACYIPAHRATKVDPMVALRYE